MANKIPAVLTILLACASAQAQITFLNSQEFTLAFPSVQTAGFELGAPVEVTTQYPGVLFSGVNDGQPTTTDALPRTGIHALTVNPEGTVGFAAGGMRMDFSPPLSGFGIQVGGLHPVVGFGETIVEVTSTTSTTSFVLQNVIGSAPVAYSFLGFTWEAPIVSVSFAIGEFDYVYFDDLVYAQAPATDTDADGVPDDLDNCVLVANDQRDSDSDGFGNACDADLNNDLIVNVVDLGVLRSRFFTADPDADFNGDGVVNVVDLGVMRQSFFGPPGPSGIAP